MKSVFVSYRRQKGNSNAGRIYDRLTYEYGRDAVFMDIDDIPPGVDFVAYLKPLLANCKVMIVVVDAGWSNAIERLHTETDYVRLEIETAINRNDMALIPILLEDEPMPEEKQLPDVLAPLTRLNAIRLRSESFSATIERKLLPRLNDLLEEKSGRAVGDK